MNKDVEIVDDAEFLFISWSYTHLTKVQWCRTCQ